jgi:glycosyltransferase involved in cell wall biosynthesis
MTEAVKKVSVIITTRNEERNIKECLDSILAQKYPKELIEIIVVDNRSYDKTAELSQVYIDKVYDFGPERSAQRNFGARKASGDYILYLDADMTLSPGLIFESVSKCEEEGLDALYIPERIVGSGFWIRVRDFERNFYNATCIDCVRFIRRDKFLEAGGFDENLTGPEDWDFDRRIRQIGSVGITELSLYHNEGRFSLKRYLKKKAYYMQWFDKYADKWGKNDPIIRKQLGFGYRFFGVFFEEGKWKALLRHPVYACAMYMLRLALGVSSLRLLWLK